MRFMIRSVIVLLGICLAACGGGGGSGGSGGGGEASKSASKVASSPLAASLSSFASSVSVSLSSSASQSSTATASQSSSMASAGQLLALSNPNPSVEAVSLFNYLQDQYGKKTLTGQQESTWASGGALHELNFISNATGGKVPAILGLDYLNHLNASNVAGVTQRAADWYLINNGIPTICWHWGAPTIGDGYENSKKAFDIDKALTVGTAENIAMIRDLDIVAVQLAKLRDKGVPVLWRPFHEFTGTWFWWGMGGADGFKRMWIYMYNYYTVTKGLNNLVWVLGYSGEPKATYYPGDQYVDVAGADTYVNHHGSLKSLYNSVAAIVGSKRPIALHENGPIPDPALVAAEGANWSFFMTWHTSFVTDGIANTSTTLSQAYNHERYITRDELPNLPNYGSAK
jgi:mannan endo-1,4-beta-mannosidase